MGSSGWGERLAGGRRREVKSEGGSEECRMQSAEWGSRECKMQSAKCKLKEAENGVSRY
jgi:hypothetical protein